MSTRPSALVLASVLLGSSLLLATGVRATTQRADAPFDQQTIARQLLSNDPSERRKALEAARTIGPPNSSQALRAALITLLERMNEIVDQSQQSQIPLDVVENPEWIARVHHTVAALKEPAAIPALANALGIFTVIRALADFGEQAAPAVVDVVMSPTRHHTAVDDGLRVLRFMVERRNTSPLSPETLAQIRRAARERLSGEQYFTTLWYAIDLAAVLDDAELRRTLEELATFPGEIAVRGVRDPRLIEQTQRRAADRLTGVPASPRPEF